MIMLSTQVSLAAARKFDSLTVGSNTYSNVVILGANATDLYFTHDRGIANVKLKFLTPDFQKLFHYDAKAASEAERNQLEEDQRYQENLAHQVFGFTNASPATGAVTATEETLADPISDQSFLGKTAPALTVEQWLDGKPDMQGKWVLISFWAPWSLPCRKVIPLLNALQKKFTTGLVVVGLSSEGEPDRNQREAVQPEFALAVDSKARLRTQLGITSVPCVLLLDPRRVVRYQGHPAALTEKCLDAWLPTVKKQ